MKPPQRRIIAPEEGIIPARSGVHFGASIIKEIILRVIPGPALCGLHAERVVLIVLHNLCRREGHDHIVKVYICKGRMFIRNIKKGEPRFFHCITCGNIGRCTAGIHLRVSHIKEIIILVK